jgi:hypothetical protein
MPIPANITAGDSASWTDNPFRTFEGALLDSGKYSLSYELRGSGAPITLASVVNGSGWKISIAPAVSASLVSGVWFWAAILTATGERITVSRGEISVQKDLSAVNSAGFDGRSDAEKALSDAESALANLHASGKKTKKYTIGTRNAEYYTAPELIAAISYWRIRVSNERASKSIKDGLGNPKNLMVRFK